MDKSYVGNLELPAIIDHSKSVGNLYFHIVFLFAHNTSIKGVVRIVWAVQGLMRIEIVEVVVMVTMWRWLRNLRYHQGCKVEGMVVVIWRSRLNMMQRQELFLADHVLGRIPAALDLQG